MKESATTLQLVHEIGLRAVGRRRLADATGLSEMTVRLELERLRNQGAVELRRDGPRLTQSGSRRFASLFRFLRDVRSLDLRSLRVDAVGLAAWLAPIPFMSAWSVRDVAVRGGATGLILLRQESGDWRFAHNGEPVRDRNAPDVAAIDAAFPDAASGDLLILAFGADRLAAGRGLWSVLAELLATAA